MLHHADVCLSGTNNIVFITGPSQSHLLVFCPIQAPLLIEDSSFFSDTLWLSLLSLQYHLCDSMTVWVELLTWYIVCWIRSTVVLHFLVFEPFISGSSTIITSLGWSYCLSGGWRRWQRDGMCGKLWKGFPLRGEGWHNWAKYIVSLKMDTHTLHTTSVRPNFLKLKVAILRCPPSFSLSSTLFLSVPLSLSSLSFSRLLWDEAFLWHVWPNYCW